MINFSFASVLMALLFGNAAIVFLALIFKNRAVMLRIGFPLLGIVCALIILRFCLPVEFASITTNIYWPHFISMPLFYIEYVLFRWKATDSFCIDVSIWNIFNVIWFMGILRNLWCYFHAKHLLYRFLCRYGKEATQMLPADSFPCRESLRKRLRVYTLPKIPSPMVCRFFPYYYILLPENVPLSEEELSLTLRHELSHILHHDLALKSVINFICMVYWWNPACPVLKEQAELLLESRVDADISAGDSKEKMRYLACLLHVFEKCSVKSEQVSPLMEMGISFSSDGNSLLVKRFELMTGGTDRKQKKSLFLLFPVCLLYLLSFLYIIEANYIPPKELAELLENYDVVLPENTFIVRKEDGTYDVYSYGEFFENTDSLKSIYDWGFKVYDSLEEALEEWELNPEAYGKRH